jgi:hypothetical protein
MNFLNVVNMGKPPAGFKNYSKMLKGGISFKDIINKRMQESNIIKMLLKKSADGYFMVAALPYPPAYLSPVFLRPTVQPPATRLFYCRLCPVQSALHLPQRQQ